MANAWASGTAERKPFGCHTRESGHPVTQALIVRYERSRLPGPRFRGDDTCASSAPNALSAPAERAVQHRADGFPAFAVEPLDLHLLDRIEVRRAGVDLDAGQQHGKLEILQICCLLHHVLAGEVVAALLEHLRQRLPD